MAEDIRPDRPECEGDAKSAGAAYTLPEAPFTWAVEPANRYATEGRVREIVREELARLGLGPAG